MSLGQENCNHVCGFTYCVMGAEVVRFGPGHVRSTVWSKPEIEDSLTEYQLALLDQNKQSQQDQENRQRPVLRLVK